VHARLGEKPDTTKWRPLNIEVQDIPFTRHLRGFYFVGQFLRKQRFNIHIFMLFGGIQ
jgi:hypothetical protein